MPHVPGHVAGQLPGIRQTGFAQELQGPELLRAVTAGVRPAGEQQQLRLGQLARTRQLSPAQEAFLLQQGQEAQAGSLVQAQLQADLARVGQEQRERLIAEGRTFQTEEEQRIFQRNAALRERLQRQSLLGSIVGSITGLGGVALGGGFGGGGGEANLGTLAGGR